MPQPLLSLTQVSSSRKQLSHLPRSSLIRRQTLCLSTANNLIFCFEGKQPFPFPICHLCKLSPKQWVTWPSSDPTSAASYRGEVTTTRKPREDMHFQCTAPGSGWLEAPLLKSVLLYFLHCSKGILKCQWSINKTFVVSSNETFMPKFFNAKKTCKKQNKVY